MRLTINVATGSVLLVVQVAALGPRELSIRLVSALELPEIALLMPKPSGFRARKLAVRNAGSDPLMLRVLPSVDAWVSSGVKLVRMAGGTYQ